jgi:cysteinyl-tRNA synthetase
MPAPVATGSNHSRLRVYNTLSRQKEEFRTSRPGEVGMYVCGPTVYKPSHVGHMVGPVIFDTIKRYLTYRGYRVTFVVNVTDVDDKLIKQAGEERITVAELAERITTDYVRNLQRLGVTSIDHMPRATEYIGEMIRFIQGLISKGFAYPAEGDVYFDISKDSDYGKLCHRDPAQMEAGARIEVSDKKRNPGDFALWKAAKPGEPTWDSPWGPGRPGWHIECSAMSMRLLGETLDIHGGGLDLQFPHHENELAQSESYTGKPFVSYWLHNGLMRIRSQARKIKDTVPGVQPSDQEELEKMSKSLGNEIVVSELFKRHEPETLRMLLISTHYRSPIEYSEDRLQEMRRGLEGFYRFFERYARVTKQDFYQQPVLTVYQPRSAEGAFLTEVEGVRSAFLECMDDDFNTGGAVGTLFELLGALNRFADARQLEGPQPPSPRDLADFQQGAEVLRELGQILGLFREPVTGSVAGNDQLVAGLMQLLIDLRAGLRDQAKKATDPELKKHLFGQTDLIRARLKDLNITLEDRAGGTGWRVG